MWTSVPTFCPSDWAEQWVFMCIKDEKELKKKKGLSSKRIVRFIDENVIVKGWQEYKPSVHCKIWDAYALHIMHPIKCDVGEDISNPSY